MNKYMIASVSFIKDDENGVAKKVKEQHLIQSETYSFAEEFVYTELGKDKISNLQLTNLKQEVIDGVIFQDEDEMFEYWFKVTISEMDSDSEKEKRFNSVFYINAEETKMIPLIIEGRMSGRHDLKIESIITSKIVDVHFND